MGDVQRILHGAALLTLIARSVACQRSVVDPSEGYASACGSQVAVIPSAGLEMTEPSGFARMTVLSKHGSAAGIPCGTEIVHCYQPHRSGETQLRIALTSYSWSSTINSGCSAPAFTASRAFIQVMSPGFMVPPSLYGASRISS